MSDYIITAKSKRKPRYEEVAVGVEVTYIMSKTVQVYTENYTLEKPDEDGCASTPEVSYEAIKDAYNDEYNGLGYLLFELSKLAKEKAKECLEKGDHSNYRKYKEIAEDADGWDVCDTEFEKI